MATRKASRGPRPGTARPSAHIDTDAASDATRAIGDSAQKIWLAGLGAFERARAEGPKMFDTLVEQGKSIGGQARDAADQALRSLRESASQAGGRFDKLEQVFEDRVSRSLRRLGVITREEVADLNQGVRDLTDQVREMMSQQGTGAARAARGGKRGAGSAKRKANRTARSAQTKVKRAAGSAERKVKRAAGTAKRKAKRAASTARRSAAQRTRRSRKGS